MTERVRCARSWSSTLMVVGALFGWGCQESPQPTAEQAWVPVRVETPNVAKNYFRVGGVFLAGQPNEAGFDEWKKDGVRTVINLRPDEELDGLDERGLVEERGMAYVHIPVTPQGEHCLTDSTVDTFLTAMESADGPIVVHCGSANRVSALWAVYLAVKQGVSPQQAIELAKMSGLKDGYAQDFAVDYMQRNCASSSEAPSP